MYTLPFRRLAALTLAWYFGNVHAACHGPEGTLYAPTDTGKSDMGHRAVGVPMFTPQQLDKIAPRTAELFAMPSRIHVADQTTPVGAVRLLQAWRRDTGIQDGMPLAKALFLAQKAYLAYLKAQHGIHPTITSNRAAFQANKLKKRTDSYTDPDERQLIEAWDKPQRLSSDTMALFGLMCHPPALNWTNDVTMQDTDVLTTRPVTGDPDLWDDIKARVSAIAN